MCTQAQSPVPTSGPVACGWGPTWTFSWTGPMQLDRENWPWSTHTRSRQLSICCPHLKRIYSRWTHTHTHKVAQVSFPKPTDSNGVQRTQRVSEGQRSELLIRFAQLGSMITLDLDVQWLNSVIWLKYIVKNYQDLKNCMVKMWLKLNKKSIVTASVTTRGLSFATEWNDTEVFTAQPH